MRCLVLLCLSGSIQAQDSHNNALLPWQSEVIGRYKNLRIQTLRLAQQHNWPLHKNYSNTQRLVLTEVDPLGHPIYYTLHNTEASSATRTLSLYKGGSLQLALSGNSSALAGKVAIWDGGRVLGTHQEFAGTGVIQQQDQADSINSHTTHLAGTLIARGINPQAKGMAYGASLLVWDYTDDLSEIAIAAPNLLLSNHAYGPVAGWVYNPSRPGTDPNQKWEWWGNTSMSATEDYLFGFYTTKAHDLDRIAYNNPFYLMVRSADNKRAETGPPAGTAYYLKNTSDKSTLTRSRNDAYDVIPGEATAKNVLTVGAADVTFDRQNQPPTIASTSFSGWGPTDDGRIKPDLLGMGTSIFSTLADNSASYGNYTGTSMASANVTGSLVLLQELYSQQKAVAASSAKTSATGSNQFMRSATLRGLAIHTASRTTPAAGPDYRQGWGLLNAEGAARVLLNTDRAHLVLEKTLQSGGIFTQRIVAQGNEPLVVTLCWTDPEGAPTTVGPAYVNNRTPRLVNDLDIRLSDGHSIALPFTLDPNNPSQPARMGDNIRDNVEQIYIPNPTPGQSYSITVSHKGKMTYAGQPFSVIISGLQRIPCAFSVSISPGSDTTLCNGSSLVLGTSNQSGFNYQWLLYSMPIVNATASSYRLTEAGAYSLRMTDANGCTVTSAPVQVRTRQSTVKINPSTDQWLCQDDQPIVFSATVSTNSPIEWLRNGTVLSNQQSTSLAASEEGSYQIRLTEDGCQTLSDSVVLRRTTVNNIPLQPEETELTLLRGAAVTLYAPTGTAYEYQWYQSNSPINKATTNRLSVSEPGSYQVQVTQQNCVGWSTQRTIYSSVITSISPEPDSVFLAYPNPVEHSLEVQYAFPNARNVQISVLDGQGRLHGSPTLLKATNQRFQGTLNLSTLSAGPYILKLSDGDRTRTLRFLKK
ncbi:S8 family peptidase [Spirosoma sp. SC4-14]|uniref:S8 family peptidase n=1 Tax=Spirosoma sp. SC4-14 TaxID=3128900 RepID=UPI0030D4CA75